jgi:hypothetical protein
MTNDSSGILIFLIFIFLLFNGCEIDNSTKQMAANVLEIKQLLREEARK